MMIHILSMVLGFRPGWNYELEHLSTRSDLDWSHHLNQSASRNWNWFDRFQKVLYFWNSNYRRLNFCNSHSKLFSGIFFEALNKSSHQVLHQVQHQILHQLVYKFTAPPLTKFSFCEYIEASCIVTMILIKVEIYFCFSKSIAMILIFTCTVLSGLFMVGIHPQPGFLVREID